MARSNGHVRCKPWVLKLAEQHDLIIIEDDIFADFEAETSPRLAA